MMIIFMMMISITMIMMVSIRMAIFIKMMIQETLAKEESENQKKALELRDLQVGIIKGPPS